MAETDLKFTTREVFMNSLRQETAPMHQKLEQSALSMALLRPDVTPADYTQYLRAMRQVVAWHENHVFPLVISVVTDLGSRHKLTMIDLDLKSLSHDGETLLPEFNPVQPPVTTAAAMGYLYVLEGSTLGGMVILKHLQGRDFATPENTSFFAGYGKNTGNLWRGFLEVLGNYAETSQQQEEIIAGARRAFGDIDVYFNTVRP